MIAVPAELEMCMGNRRNVGKAPVFVPCGGEAGFIEALKAALPKLAQPSGLSACGTLLKSAESFRVCLQGLSCCRHCRSLVQAGRMRGAVAGSSQAGVALALRTLLS